VREGVSLSPLPRDRARRYVSPWISPWRATDGASTDLHTGNVAFALSVDIQSWTVEELYEALGGEPFKVPFAQAPYLSMSGLAPTDSPHQPKYLVSTPPVSRLWELCSSSLQPPNIRIIDFTESFRVPFSHELQRLPGTPRDFAAPELLLIMPSEITTAIDIWALGCTIYQMLGQDNPFIEISGMFVNYIAEILVLLGGEENAHVPERFQKAFCESQAVEVANRKKLEDPFGMNWDEKMVWLRGDPEEGAVPLEKADEAVLRRVIDAALVIEPANRAGAEAILAMMLEGWENTVGRI
jgi:hypothetical protein